MQATANPDSLRERKGFCLDGRLVAVATVVLVLVAAGILFSVAIIRSTQPHSGAAATPVGLLPAFLLILVALLLLRGFRLVRPDEALVLYSGDRYVGTVRGSGLIWTNPFLSRRKIRLQPFSLNVTSPAVTRAESSGKKAVQADIVWHVTDTAKALSAPENYVDMLRREAAALLQSYVAQYGQTAGGADESAFRDQLQRKVEPLGLAIDRVELRGAGQV